MKSIEQIFEETSVKFRAQMIDAVEAAIEGVYKDYLPHVENDTYFNVNQAARQMLIDFMADKLDDHQKKMLNFEIKSIYLSQQVRAKMFQDNKEELTKIIGQDILDRLYDLEQRVVQNWEIKYG